MKRLIVFDLYRKYTVVDGDDSFREEKKERKITEASVRGILGHSLHILDDII